MTNPQGYDQLPPDAPIVIGASFMLLVLGIVSQSEWSDMTDTQRVERMEQAGYQWNGQRWERTERQSS